MKSEDLASLIVVAVLAVGGVGGFLYWRHHTAQEAERQYEAAIDDMMDRKLAAVQLDGIVAQLEPQGDGRLAALEMLYADRDYSDRLNLGFGTVHADWATYYPRFAEEQGRAVDDDLFRAEWEERFGAGSYPLVLAQYDAFLLDAPRRQVEEDARRRAECEAQARALRAQLTCYSIEGTYVADGR